MIQHLQLDSSLSVRLREGCQLLVAWFLSFLSSVRDVGVLGSWCAVTAAYHTIHNCLIDTLHCLWLFVLSTCCLWSEPLNPVLWKQGLLLSRVLSPAVQDGPPCAITRWSVNSEAHIISGTVLQELVRRFTLSKGGFLVERFVTGHILLWPSGSLVTYNFITFHCTNVNGN